LDQNYQVLIDQALTSTVYEQQAYFLEKEKKKEVCTKTKQRMQSVLQLENKRIAHEQQKRSEGEYRRDTKQVRKKKFASTTPWPPTLCHRLPSLRNSRVFCNVVAFNIALLSTIVIGLTGAL